jgi:hypothetical protein
MGTGEPHASSRQTCPGTHCALAVRRPPRQLQGDSAPQLVDGDLQAGEQLGTEDAAGAIGTG